MRIVPAIENPAGVLQGLPSLLIYLNNTPTSIQDLAWNS